MIAAVIKALLAGAWKPLAWLLGAVGLYAKGRGDAKRQTARKTAEQAVKDERTRERIEDDIQQDADLVARAKRAGIVRIDRP